MLHPTSVPVPVLTTERLILRGHRLDDFDASLGLWSHETVTRFIGGKPATADEVWVRLLRYAGHWAMLGFGYWAIEDRASGGFIGEAGFHDLKRPLDPSFDGAPEIGWALVPSQQGKGLASEAVAAMLAWGDQAFGETRTVCMINPDNAPSIRLAEKAGYGEYARTTYKGSPTILFERTP